MLEKTLLFPRTLLHKYFIFYKVHVLVHLHYSQIVFTQLIMTHRQNIVTESAEVTTFTLLKELGLYHYNKMDVHRMICIQYYVYSAIIMSRGFNKTRLPALIYLQGRYFSHVQSECLSPK